MARHIRTVISRQNSSWLRKVDTRKCARDAWTKVREVIGGKTKRDHPDVEGITAQILNDHYAAISTDQYYQESRLKQTALDQRFFITEMEVFRILDHIRPTATGLDDIPAWFLRLGAPVFAGPIAQLFNKAITAGTVPSQWKAAIITPVPKVSKPSQPSDFRPISITPVLSRSFEKYIVRSYIYPALQEPPSGLYFAETSLPSGQPARPQQQSSLSSIPYLQCCHPMPLSVSWPWTFPRPLTPYGTPHWWKRWHSWSCRTRFLTGLKTSLTVVRTAVHEIRRRSVDMCQYSSQRDTRIRSRPSNVLSHRIWSATGPQW